VNKGSRGANEHADAPAFVAGVTVTLATGCRTQSNIGSKITVENIRRIQLGMSRADVEQGLGEPVWVDQLGAIGSDGTSSGEVMVYFRRLPPPLRCPMLWVHLRDGKVSEVYAKRHDIFDSWGVYGLTVDRRWETPEFLTTFPTLENGSSP
jgi:hypothetical protein